MDVVGLCRFCQCHAEGEGQRASGNDEPDHVACL
jgi:hypothetical protein